MKNFCLEVNEIRVEKHYPKGGLVNCIVDI